MHLTGLFDEHKTIGLRNPDGSFTPFKRGVHSYDRVKGDKFDAVLQSRNYLKLPLPGDAATCAEVGARASM